MYSSKFIIQLLYFNVMLLHGKLINEIRVSFKFIAQLAIGGSLPESWASRCPRTGAGAQWPVDEGAELDHGVTCLRSRPIENSLITFLNSQSRELNLALDPNDFSPQTLFTNYHLEDDIISFSHSIPNQLFISHFNIRSLNKNFDQFHLLINQLKFDYGIIGVSETWLKETSPSSLFGIEGFTLVTNNRTGKRGGGVGFYITKNLNYDVLHEFNVMSEVFESVFIESKVPNRNNIIVGEIYRPPNSSPVEFTELFHALLSNKHFDNKTCFIMGDFNLNLLNCHDNPTSQDFLNLMLSNSFIPLTIGNPLEYLMSHLLLLIIFLWITLFLT